MKKHTVNILTPVGRIVRGSCYVPRKVDAHGDPLLIKRGPNMGQPRVEYFIALAIPKDCAEYGALKNKIDNFAKVSFPANFDENGICIHPSFAFKITDGDSNIPNGKNIKPCDRDGFPGHWVLKFTTGFEPVCYTHGGTKTITADDTIKIKCGDYIRIAGSIRSNESDSKPGIFLNATKIELVGFGNEIVDASFSGEAIFGGQPITSLPEGARAVSQEPVTSSVAKPQRYFDGVGKLWTRDQLLQGGFNEEQIQALRKE